MDKLVLVKLGGSLITDKKKAFHAREGVIRRLAREIKEVIKEKHLKVIIGHGSGSFGHTVAAKYRTHEGLINKKSLEGLSLVADVAIKINRIVVKNFLRIGLPVFSFAPASFLLSKNQKVNKKMLEPIAHALGVGLISIIYGDVVLDIKKGCAIFSAEKTLDILALFFKNRFSSIKVISCGDTDGVYDEKGKTIPVITPISFKNFRKSIGKSGVVDVTGGMSHKVIESLNLTTKAGIETLIINGKVKDNLKKALLSKAVQGTFIRG